MKPFHETTPEERQGLTVGQAMERFTQPAWCGYFEALAGVLGCWSLLGHPADINFDYCKNCEFHKDNDNVQ
jgi:hypothetical protein